MHDMGVCEAARRGGSSARTTRESCGGSSVNKTTSRWTVDGQRHAQVVQWTTLADTDWPRTRAGTVGDLLTD